MAPELQWIIEATIILVFLFCVLPALLELAENKPLRNRYVRGKEGN